MSLPPIAQREIGEGDVDNGERMKSTEPSAALSVPNTLTLDNNLANGVIAEYK